MGETGSTKLPLDAAVVDELAAALGTRHFAIRPIGGVQSLNNDVCLLVAADGRRLALRRASPRAATRLGVDWREEASVAMAAGRAGLGPEIIHANPQTGLMLSRWVPTVPFGPEQMRDPRRRRAVVELAGALHRLAPPPLLRRTIFERIALMDAGLERNGTGMPDPLRRRLADLAAASAPQPGPVHHDLWANNLLDDGQRLLLTDWEFAGLGDGVYDLASIAIAAELDAPGQRDLLSTAGHPAGEMDRLGAMIWVVRYFEACWGLTMAQQGARAADAGGHAFDFSAHGARMLALLGR